MVYLKKQDTKQPGHTILAYLDDLHIKKLQVKPIDLNPRRIWPIFFSAYLSFPHIPDSASVNHAHF